MPDFPESVSLLWPTGSPSLAKRNWQSNSIADLGLDPLINALNFDGKHADSVKNILLSLCDQPDIIRYRQDIIEDFLRSPDLIQQFESLLPKLSDLAYYSKISQMPALPFQKTLARMGELELYIQVVETLASFFHDSRGALTSTGFANLQGLLQQKIQDPVFKQMQTALPELTAKFREIKSLTIGVNLDHNLLPIEATIVSINSTPFQGSSFMKKLFGQRDEFHGISQLHSVPMRSIPTADGRLVETQLRTDPLLVPLFKDLDMLIADAFRPIMTALKSFLKVSAEFLAVLEPEIVFYLGAIRLIRQLQASGLPMCRADIQASEERLCVIRDCYNLHLALRSLYRNSNANLSGRVIGNDVKFDADGRIFIITGPNQGGKTTYIQALALGAGGLPGRAVCPWIKGIDQPCGWNLHAFSG